MSEHIGQQPVEFEYGIAFQINPDLDLLEREGPDCQSVKPVPLVNNGNQVGTFHILKEKFELDNIRTSDTPLGPIKIMAIIQDGEIIPDHSNPANLPLRTYIELYDLSQEEALKHYIEVIIEGEPVSTIYLDEPVEEDTAWFDIPSYFPNHPDTFDKLSFRINITQA